MKQYPLRMTNELHARLVKSAKKSGRSLQGEMTAALEDWVRVPIIGSVKADGTVEMDPAYADYLSGKDPCDPRD